MSHASKTIFEVPPSKCFAFIAPVYGCRTVSQLFWFTLHKSQKFKLYGIILKITNNNNNNLLICELNLINFIQIIAIPTINTLFEVAAMWLFLNFYIIISKELRKMVKNQMKKCSNYFGKMTLYILYI